MIWSIIPFEQQTHERKTLQDSTRKTNYDIFSCSAKQSSLDKVTNKFWQKGTWGWCIHALITSSYTLLLFSLLMRFSASKLLLLPKKSILLKATSPFSTDSTVEYKDRSRSACRESVCKAMSISLVDMFSYEKKRQLSVVNILQYKKSPKWYAFILVCVCVMSVE